MPTITMTPQTIEFILIGIIFEFFAIGSLLWARGGAQWIMPLFLFLASGAAMLLALRTALMPDPPGVVIKTSLTLSGVMHLALIAHMVRRRGRVG
ncbi:MAG: hypothetical protein AAF720_10575 [Pseudomonadota bacterium]